MAVTTCHEPRPQPSRRRPTGVVMDDGIVIRTTVTSSAHDVVAFLREVQERFRQEVREHENESLREGQEQHDGREEPEDRPCIIVVLHTERRDQTTVLQLCVADRCLVYQIHHAVYVPAELEDFLASPDFCFVAVGVAGHVRRLCDDCDLEVAHALDLRHVAAVLLGRAELRDAGLHTLACEVMGLIDKPNKVTMSSNRTEPDMSPEQIDSTYACMNAFMSFHVGRRLLCKPCV